MFPYFHNSVNDSSELLSSGSIISCLLRIMVTLLIAKNNFVFYRRTYNRTCLLETLQKANKP